MTQPNSTALKSVQVEKGMILLVREEASYRESGFKYDLWAVTSVRRSGKRASLKLLRNSPGAIIEATATFPDGEVRDPWFVFDLSQGDYATVYKALSAPVFVSDDPTRGLDE